MRTRQPCLHAACSAGRYAEHSLRALRPEDVVAARLHSQPPILAICSAAFSNCVLPPQRQRRPHPHRNILQRAIQADGAAFVHLHLPTMCNRRCMPDGVHVQIEAERLAARIASFMVAARRAWRFERICLHYTDPVGNERTCGCSCRRYICADHALGWPVRRSSSQPPISAAASSPGQARQTFAPLRHPAAATDCRAPPAASRPDKQRWLTN